ncbi:predicted protein [Naegleria gruberi]|uniref:Predicted protein n=1 Tax=Naegleria gruberi TaxID=5762 RepID=D2VQ57_NAEGR|nr:uncharacterized protein NAEGRDRAFT_80800 [Naegleria gruberi]EFC41047.1 predicted protein [Naegleria gruberi]|eukprot:XP_002673791.1 predicted protein [Naegleria gruberi strain NEG-M]
MSQASSAKMLKEHAKLIKECMGKQDWKGALVELKKALKLDNTNFNMFLYCGFCLGKLYVADQDEQYFTQAEQAYEKAASLQKDSEQPLLGLLELYEQKLSSATECRKKALQVCEKLLPLLKSKDQEKWLNHLGKYHQWFNLDIRSLSESELTSALISKYEKLINDFSIIAEKSSSSKYTQMLDTLFLEQYRERLQIDKLLDEKVQEQILELREKQKKKLLKEKKKLSDRELEKLMPSDIELLPMNKREELKVTLKVETTQFYYSQNLETSVDNLLAQIVEFCKKNEMFCDFHVFDKMIERTQQRFRLVQDKEVETKLKQGLVSICKEALSMHKNYFKAIEQLFLINEEDNYDIFDEKNLQEKVITRRMLHLFPYEGLSYIKLFELLRKENIKSDKIEDELMILLQRGIELIPHFIQGWILLSELYLSLEKYKNASEIARKGLLIVEERKTQTKASLDKQVAKLKILQAYSLLKFGALAEAEEIYKEVMQNDADNLDAIKGIADIEYQRGNLTKSREYYVRAIQINPQDDLTLCQTGWFCYLDKDYDAAVKYINAAIEVNPNNYLYFFRLSKVYWDWNESYRQDKQYCYSLLLKSARLNPNFSSNYAYLGHFYKNIEQDEDRCIKCYKKAVTLNPLEDEAGENLGDIYISKGQLTLAASLFQDATSRNNRAGWAWAKLGFYQQSQNLLDESILSFQHALRVSPLHALCWEGLGESYKQEGKYLAALKAFSRAVELDSSLVFSMVQSAFIKFQLSEYDNSREIYEKVIALNEKFSVAYEGIAAVLFKVAQNYYSDGLFTQCAHQVIRAQCVLTNGIKKHFATLKTLWKLLGDIQSYCFQIPERNIVEAISTYRELCKNDNSIYIETFQDELKTKLDYLKQASTSFTSLISLDENDSDTWFDLAVSEINQLFDMVGPHGDDHKELRGKALEHIRKAITLSPHNSNYWNCMGIISDNDVVKQHCYIRATQIDTKNHIAWNNLGALYLKNFNLKLARKAFLKAQAIYPESSVAWVGLALINENVTNREGVIRAKEDFKHSTTLENVPPAYLGLAYTSLLSNDSIYAIQSIMKYFQFNTTDYAAWNILGVALEMQQQYEKSLEAFNKCEGLLIDYQIKYKSQADTQQKGFIHNTKSIIFAEADLYSVENMLYLVRINKARVLCKLSKFNDASSVFELCKQYSSDDMGILMGSAITSCFASDFSFSIKSILSAIESSSKKIKEGLESEKRLIELYNLIAKVYYQQKDFKKAKEYFEKCINEFPSHEEAYLSLTSLLVVAEPKNSTPALEVIRKLKARQSSLSLETTKLEALIYCSYGEYEKARNSICKVIHMNPAEPKLWDLLSQVTLDYQFISMATDVKKKNKKSKAKFEVDETPIASTNSGAISQLTTQLLQNSLSKFSTETFVNDKSSVIERLYNIACLYYAMGSAPSYHNARITLKHAMSMAQKALMLDPSNMKIFRLLTSCTHSLSLIEKENSYNKAAGTLLKSYLEINDTVTDLPLQIALLEQYIYNGEYTKCMGAIKSLMEKHKDNATIESSLFALLGKCILAKGESMEKVMKLFTNSLKKDNTNLYAWYTLATILINQKKFTMAKYCVESCLSISKKNNDLSNEFLSNSMLAYICLMISLINNSKEMITDGIQFTKNAFRINNESAPVYLIYGKLQFLNGNLEEALNAFQQVIRIDPEQPLASINMYWVHYNKENWGPAEESLWAEKSKSSNQAEVVFTLASFAFESEMPAPALKFIQKAIRLDPSNTKYWDYLDTIQQALKPKEPVKPQQQAKKKK